MEKRILILGGYGNTGLKVAELLLEYTGTNVVLGARNRERLTAAAGKLKARHSADRVSTVVVDASDPALLEQAFRAVDIVVVASSTARYTSRVAEAALRVGVDYLDVHYSSRKVPVLKSLADRIEASGRCFITEAGFHPGMLATLVRYGARFFDRLESAVVASVVQQDWAGMDLSPATMIEFAQELLEFKTLFYRDGAWRRAGMLNTKDFVTVDFGEPYGKRLCAPMFFEELHELPARYPSLTRLGFYIAGFHPFVDYFVMPVAMVTLKLFPRAALRPVGRFLYWGLSAFSKPPYATVLKLEATGEMAGEPKIVEVQLFHENGYWFTAIPVAACLLQYLDGSIRKPGLYLMGNLVEPVRLMKNIERMGIKIA
jgi:saccharopine dehydrogenase (NAD+, L-lysine-forming)